ncbi:MAG: hypothetical protein OEM04_07000 [Flavobacteriaceae bacterium]|nr:hypothetical protein [Flavobacteriaceae bacterium]
MYKLLLICLLVPVIGIANPNPVKGKYEKTKTLNKTFNVNADALLKIDNKYGNLDVISWNENRVVIEVKITVNGDKEDKVISQLEKIDVEFEGSPSLVSAKTVIEKTSSGWFSSGKNGMNYQIDYKVKMPVSNHANFINDYGTISLNELKGKANINCDYGKILIGSLHHADNVINMDYTSNSVIEFMNSGKINADYSKLRIEKAKRVDLNADYTTSVFENIENLTFNCDYGNIEAENANHIQGNGDYLTMRFGTIYKNLKIEADYGGVRIDKLMKGFKSVVVNSDYTGIKIGLDDAAAFDFKVKLSYGGMSYDGEGINYVKKEEKNFSKYYEGFVNKENSSSKIEISSDYGSVKFYNN